VVTTREHAVQLYNDVVQIPWSQTRAEVLTESNVTIDGIMPIAGAQTATFHYAFDNNIPKVLKIPMTQAKVNRECAMYEELGTHAETCSLALVPVRKLKLRGTVRDNRYSPEKLVEQGILMPPYWCTVGDIPTPASATRALSVFERVSPALQYLHQHGWIHGDVKPANIFLDVAGHAWLGDYGTSIKAVDFESFTGGTLKYQLADVTIKDGPRFDRVGLALVLLDLLGVNYGQDYSTKDIRALVNAGRVEQEVGDKVVELIS
jgi:serine/threonine protein kinase